MFIEKTFQKHWGWMAFAARGGFPHREIRSRSPLFSLIYRDELQILRTGVIRARPDDLVVDALLDDVRAP
ncbi:MULTISPECIES: hypothetical protein, partial [Caballeronia]|uniref:hypothetical protein n=1 Tax=Caballeronia TaxID=1827195 RepID=UPI001F51DDF0